MTFTQKKQSTDRVRFSFWLYPELLAGIKAAARAEEMTASAWVRRALKQASNEATINRIRRAMLVQENAK